MNRVLLYSATGMLVVACTWLAILRPVLALAALLGGIFLLVLAFRPKWMFHLLLISAFMSMPVFVPRVIPGVGLYLFEPFLVASAALVAFMVIRKRKVIGLIGFVVMLALSLTIGLISDNSVQALLVDIRPLVDLILAVIVGAGASQYVEIRSILRTTKWLLWISLAITLLASFDGLVISGRSEIASLEGAEEGAERLITSATYFALAASCASFATLIVKNVRLRGVLPFLLPSLAIIFLSFSRNNLIAIGVAIIWAFIIARYAKNRISGAARLTLLVAIASAIIGFVAYFLNVAWLQEQINGFSTRVLEGLTPGGIASDGSAQFRVQENEAILPVIAEAPIFGHGLGADYKEPLPFPEGHFLRERAPYYAHNFYLWVMLKGGIALLVTFVYMMCRPILGSLRSSSPVLAVLACVSLAFATVSFIAPMPIGMPTSVLFGLLIGVTSSAWKEDRLSKGKGTTEHQPVRAPHLS